MILKNDDKNIEMMLHTYEIGSVFNKLKENDIDTNGNFTYYEQFMDMNNLRFNYDFDAIEKFAKNNSSIKYKYNKINEYIHEVEIKGFLLDIISFCNMFELNKRETLQKRLANEIGLYTNILNGLYYQIHTSTVTDSSVIHYLNKVNMMNDITYATDLLLGILSSQYHSTAYTLVNDCVKKIYGCDIKGLDDLYIKTDDTGRSKMNINNIDDNVLNKINDYIQEMV